MSKGLSAQERLIRIELARTRAALERQNVTRSLCSLQDSLTPAGLWQSLFSGVRSRRSRKHYGSLLATAAGLSRRYPLLLTTASAALTSLGRGRTGWFWRLALGGLTAWKIAQRVQGRPRDGAVKTTPPLR